MWRGDARTPCILVTDMTKVAIIGAGNVGRALGAALAEAGHAISYAVREPGASRYQDLRAQRCELRSVADAVDQADVVIVATPWSSTEAALSATSFAGRVLLDATNPIGPDLELTHGHNDSGAEQVQRWAPSARVVKVFNSTGYENMASSAYPSATPAMLLCGDDSDARAIAGALCQDIGFEPLDVGDLSQARLLEPFAMVWIRLALVQGHGRNIAFSVLRR